MSSDGGSNYGDWQASPTFDSLTAGTTYYFQTRYVAVDTEHYSNSDPSAEVAATTSVAMTYTLTVDSSITHGTVTLDPASAAQAGQTVTVTLHPEAGYYVDTVRYTTDGSTYTTLTPVNGVYSFVMPTDSVTVTASFAIPITTIASAQELAEFAETVNSGYSYAGQTVTLANDITLTGTWTPIGQLIEVNGSWVGAFSGTFDGGNHTISGLNVTTASGDGAGLFGNVKGGTIKNLNVNGTVSCGVFYVGGIAGYITNTSTISDCVSYVNVTNTGSSGGFAGGITGDTGYYNNNIQNCKNYGNISSTGTAGGIAGRSDNALGSGSISGCGNYGAVSGMSHAGGIVAKIGGNNAAISNCYNTGDV